MDKKNMFRHTKQFFIEHKVMLFSVVLSIFVFLILYRKFIFGGYAYAYTANDIGSDTFDTYYPRLYFISNMLHSGEISTYSLQFGFGTSIVSILQGIFNPFDLITIVCKPEQLYIALIIVTAFKYITITFFSIKYFRLIFKDQRITACLSFLWTFSSFIVVWGQHYKFATTMVFFTMFLYYFQRFLMERKLSYKFIITMILYVLCSYYFFYSTGVFAGIYVLLYARYQHWNLKQTFYTLGILLIGACISILLSAALLVPILCVFFQSARTGAVSESLFSLGDFDGSLLIIVSLIGRFLSSDLIGNGGALHYSGKMNYYEFAFLSTSVLSIYAISYYVLSGHDKWKKLLIVMGVVALLLWSKTNYFLCFDNKMRWTYILLIPILLLIGKYLSFLLNSYEKKMVTKTVSISVVLYIIFVGILLHANNRGTIQLNKAMLLIVSIVFVLYGIFSLKKLIKHKQFTYLIFIVILGENIFLNNSAINHRGIEKIKVLEESYYFDGTQDALEQVQSQDPSYYRVNKAYSSRFYNDAYIQGYNGVASYDSFNAKTLDTFTKRYDLETAYQLPQYQNIPISRKFINSLFAVKYIVTDEGDYKKADTFNWWLPFGYLYEDIYENHLPISDDLLIGDYSNYVTKETSLLELKKEVVNGIWEKNILSAKSGDSQIIIKIPDEVTGDYQLHLNYTASENSNAQIFYANNKEFTEEQSKRYTIEKGNNQMIIPLSDYFTTNTNRFIRIDATEAEQTLTFHKLAIQHYDLSSLVPLFETYRNESLKITNQDISSYKGTIENLDTKSKNFFIPILYSNEWSLEVDGQKQQLNNTNGFMTSTIRPGKHTIKLTFTPAGVNEGLAITIISLLGIIYVQFKYKFLLK